MLVIARSRQFKNHSSQKSIIARDFAWHQASYRQCLQHDDQRALVRLCPDPAAAQSTNEPVHDREFPLQSRKISAHRVSSFANVASAVKGNPKTSIRPIRQFMDITFHSTHLMRRLFAFFSACGNLNHCIMRYQLHPTTIGVILRKNKEQELLILDQTPFPFLTRLIGGNK